MGTCTAGYKNRAILQQRGSVNWLGCCSSEMDDSIFIIYGLFLGGVGHQHCQIRRWVLSTGHGHLYRRLQKQGNIAATGKRELAWLLF